MKNFPIFFGPKNPNVKIFEKIVLQDLKKKLIRIFFYDLEFSYTFDLAHPECLRECITSQLKNSVLDSTFMYPDQRKIDTWSLRTESWRCVPSLTECFSVYECLLVAGGFFFQNSCIQIIKNFLQNP